MLVSASHNLASSWRMCYSRSFIVSSTAFNLSRRAWYSVSFNVTKAPSWIVSEVSLPELVSLLELPMRCLFFSPFFSFLLSSGFPIAYQFRALLKGFLKTKSYNFRGAHKSCV